MAPPTLADYGRHFDTTVPTITRVTEKISTAEQVGAVQRKYPAGFEISKDMVVLCKKGRHPQTEHAMVFYALVEQPLVLRRLREPFLKVRPFYVRDDLDVSNLAGSTLQPVTKAAIQGLHQCVLAKDSEHVHVTQVIGLEHVPMLEATKISFPLVLAHTMWYRRDVEMEVVAHNEKTKVLRAVKAVVPFCTAQCTKMRAYSAAEDVVRWCEDCGEWFHEGCLQQRNTVEFYREEHAREPYTDFAPWVLWDTEETVPPAVYRHFVGLITTPIRQCYPEVSPNHILTAEVFLSKLRDAAKRPGFVLPRSERRYRGFVDTLLVPTLVRPDIRDPHIDQFIEYLTQMNLGEKMLYQCPRHPDHVI
ncbi:hypothetical protein C8T65DRAFT_701285 [Cerioporus squamosus]|nr:hypothetical protein C8T65DRAFT_701285 [Cerioporus squamosus]